MAGDPARILIVRLGALGDIVHAIPVAAALRRAFPSARIDWLVSAKHRAMVDLVPVIDRRVVLNDRAGARGGESLPSIVRAVRAERYDVAVDLQGLLKSALLARATGAARVIGFSSRYARESAARLFYTDSYHPAAAGVDRGADAVHVVQANLGMLTLLGVAAGPAEFPIDEGDSRIAREVAERTSGRYALLNPGAGWPNKRWPPERFAAIASRLRASHGLVSVVLWGEGERQLADLIGAAAPDAAIVPPSTSLADIVALARAASLMVSGDTGPAHIAAAVGTPLVGIYGPTRAARNGPLSRSDIAVSRDDRCECPLQRRCTAARWCLLDISVDEVGDAAARRLMIPARA